jgi:hypothetical protein
VPARVLDLLLSTVRSVDLTDSYLRAFPADLRARYEFAETRQAAAIMQATNPAAFGGLVEVLDGFELRSTDLTTPGGQETDLAARLNDAFRARGWREARVDTLVRLSLVQMPLRSAGETQPVTVDTETLNEGYKVDNFRDRVALDVEWNAKDGNLDRDIGAYRSLYESALIDVGIVLTRVHSDLKQLGYRLGIADGLGDERARKILATSTTTNMEKLLPRMTRGDGGGCPLLAICISPKTLRPGPWNPPETTADRGEPLF